MKRGVCRITSDYDQMASRKPAIRKAKEGDISPILALLSEIDLANEKTISLDKAKAIFQRMASYPDYHIYLAEIDREIVGGFSLLIMDNLAHEGAPSGIIEDVAVKPVWQRRGIGKAMMEFAMQQCKEAGCYKMVLSSNLVRDDAHRFYETLGFKKHGYSFVADVS